MWTNEQDTLRADKMNLFLYFQEYQKDSSAVSDGVLKVVCQTAREVLRTQGKTN